MVGKSPVCAYLQDYELKTCIIYSIVNDKNVFVLLWEVLILTNYWFLLKLLPVKIESKIKNRIEILWIGI